ncbi:hypothetical protein [Bradyrhizobium sp.]|uniref:hypothetical protein n=1 Tax=Bradyrhizobium sp. TaxID=376 RepID=UPI0025B7BBFD|nr:hypothetical protein [Bradyrhizobium sp.]
MFNGDLLLSLAAMPIEGLQERRVRPRELVCLGEILPPALECLLTKHCAPVAFHRCVMASNELRCQHAFQLVVRANPNKASHGGID